jgi:hypothetical protein
MLMFSVNKLSFLEQRIQEVKNTGDELIDTESLRWDLKETIE